MIPHDGHGYGRNLTWHYKALSIAKETNENCLHLDINHLSLEIDSTSNDKYRNVKFNLKCVNCDQNFEKTEKILRKRFLEFYGLT
jgi:hypothetical protein